MSKGHSFGAIFIRKVKNVTKRSSQLLNHNLQKRTNISLHLPAGTSSSLEQGEHRPSTVVAGTDKRAALQHSLTCPAR